MSGHQQVGTVVNGHVRLAVEYRADVLDVCVDVLAAERVDIDPSRRLGRVDLHTPVARGTSRC
ncbi:MAG: hypothetical protein ACTHMY_07475, partial [Solirubrobacteraceae bacterium]